MLKLTQVEYTPEGPIWIMASHISALQPAPSGGTSVWTGSTSVWVRETAEEIMALPEMTYAMFPLMTVR